ncbi:MAG: putative Ig domain-containing protein [Ancalomicrobiaceae bacterium]|nr:putative Ig domain-containing protein [Ancalomicrobiaceae bacterium]
MSSFTTSSRLSQLFGTKLAAAAAVKLTAPTARQSWLRDQPTRFTLAANTFTDFAGGAPTFTATTGTGSALPSWLQFDALTGTFSGIAAAGPGVIDVKATTAHSVGASLSETFKVRMPVPAAPVVATPLAAETWKPGQTVNLTLPSAAFIDPQGQALTYKATLASGAALPSWLHFDSASATFTGTVPLSAAAMTIKVTATDTGKATASESFDVAVGSPVDMRAASFLDTVGVDTHLHYSDGQYRNVAQVLSELAYLGITNVRDNIGTAGPTSTPFAPFVTLANAGISFTLMANATSTSAEQANLQEIANLNSLVPGSVFSVEGANEINNWPVTFNGVSGLQGALDLQSYIYSFVHSSSALSGVKVSYFTGYGAGNVANGPNPLTTPGLADLDNQHPYPTNGQAPATPISPTKALTNEPGSTGPAIYTETGYSTVGTGAGVVNQDVQAKYTLDLLLDAAKDGVTKTYLYQLMDAYAPGSKQGDDGYGLFDYTQTPKEAAVAIHNLTTILKDPGTNAQDFATGSLAYTIQGLPTTANSLLMEKSDGSYELAIWNEPRLWDPTTKTELAATTTTVTLQLSGTAAQVNVYDPLSGTSPVSTATNVASLQLGLSDRPLIIEISQAAANLTQAIASVSGSNSVSTAGPLHSTSTPTGTLASPIG